MPSMMDADGSGLSFAGDTFFSNSLARAASLVLRSDPSPISSAYGEDPIAHLQLSAFCNGNHLAELCFLTAFRTTSSPRPWFRGFFLMSEKVFSFFFVVLLWNCVDGASSGSRSCLKVWYASSPILQASKKILGYFWLCLGSS